MYRFLKDLYLLGTTAEIVTGVVTCCIQATPSFLLCPLMPFQVYVPYLLVG